MIILDEIVSADWYAARLDGSIDFFVDLEGMVDSVGHAERMSGVSAVLLGARTYREFSDYWPGQDPGLPVNRLPKHVLSSTLGSAPWGRLPAATVERGDLTSVLDRLQERYDGDLIVWGSLTLASAIVAAGAADELWLRVVPVALGAGRGFLPARDTYLTLLESARPPGGWSTARYRLGRP